MDQIRIGTAERLLDGVLQFFSDLQLHDRDDETSIEALTAGCGQILESMQQQGESLKNNLASLFGRVENLEGLSKQREQLFEAQEENVDQQLQALQKRVSQLTAQIESSEQTFSSMKERSNSYLTREKWRSERSHELEQEKYAQSQKKIEETIKKLTKEDQAVMHSSAVKECQTKCNSKFDPTVKSKEDIEKLTERYNGHVHSVSMGYVHTTHHAWSSGPSK